MNWAGMLIVDVTNPYSVEAVAEFDPHPAPEMWASGLDMVADRLYLAVQSGDPAESGGSCVEKGELLVIDVSDPTNPATLGLNDTSPMSPNGASVWSFWTSPTPGSSRPGEGSRWHRVPGISRWLATMRTWPVARPVCT